MFPDRPRTTARLPSATLGTSLRSLPGWRHSPRAPSPADSLYADTGAARVRIAPAPAQVGRGAVEHRNRLHVADQRLLGAGPAHEGVRLSDADRREDVRGGDFVARIQDEGRSPALPYDDALHAAVHPPFAPRLAILVEEDAQQDAHPLPRPGEALQVERPEHDDELIKVHVVLAGAAVEHEGAEQHVLEQRVVDQRAHELPGGSLRPASRERALAHELGDPGESLRLPGKLGRDLGLQEGKVVGEPQRHPAPRPQSDARTLLRPERQLLPVDPQLAQDLPERRPLDPGRDEIGDRVESDVVLAAADAVEAVQAADRAVALKDADPLAEVRQPYPRRQAGETGADDGDVVLRGRGWRHAWV